MANNIEESKVPVTPLQYVLGFDASGNWAKQDPVTGAAGATFTPSVSGEGELSWTNDKGLPNPVPVNIKGQKGDPGPQGAPGDAGDLAQSGNSPDKSIAGVIKPAPIGLPYRENNDLNLMLGLSSFYVLGGVPRLIPRAYSPLGGDLLTRLGEISSDSYGLYFIDGRFIAGTWKSPSVKHTALMLVASFYTGTLRQTRAVAFDFDTGIVWMTTGGPQGMGPWVSVNAPAVASGADGEDDAGGASVAAAEYGGAVPDGQTEPEAEAETGKEAGDVE